MMATNGADTQLPLSLFSPWLAMINALQPAVSAAQGNSFTQPILPWTFGNVINVTDRNSSAPEVERDIVAQDSYGRQLGRLMDAVAVLIEQRPKNAPRDQALDDLLALHRKIDGIKADTAASRLSRIKADLTRLEKENPPQYRELLATLQARQKSK
ncbi:MAG: hypothetical protein V4634_14220 [Pseudomonadota bacterium]